MLRLVELSIPSLEHTCLSITFFYTYNFAPPAHDWKTSDYCAQETYSRVYPSDTQKYFQNQIRLCKRISHETLLARRCTRIVDQYS